MTPSFLHQISCMKNQKSLDCVILKMVPQCVWSVTRNSVVPQQPEHISKNNIKSIEAKTVICVQFVKKYFRLGATWLITWKSNMEFPKKCIEIHICLRIDRDFKCRMKNNFYYQTDLKFFLLVDFWRGEPKELGLCDLDDGSTMCLKCHKKFTNTSIAKTHFKEMHQVDRTQKNYFCPICQKGFAVQRYMANHMKIQHGVSQKMYKNTYVP